MIRSVTRPTTGNTTSRVVGGGGGGGATPTEPPTITAQPGIAEVAPKAANEVYEGENAVITVAATGATSYQWQTSPDDSTWNNVGTNNTTYTISSAVRATHDGLYIRCRVTNAAGTTDSDSFQLSVWNPLDLGADLAVWLDPTFGLFTERTGASATTSSGANDPVGTWRAKNGTINGTAGTDVKRPTYRSAGLNSTPAIETDGIDDSLDFTTSLAATFRNKPVGYIFAGVAPTRENATAYVMGFSIGGGTLSRAIVGVNFGNVGGTLVAGGRRLDANSFASATASDSFTNDEAFVLSGEFLWESAACHVRKNGVRVGSNTSFQTAGNTSDTASDNIFVGDFVAVGGSPFDGMIGHAIATCPSSPHTTATMRKIEGFIAYKQGTALA